MLTFTVMFILVVFLGALGWRLGNPPKAASPEIHPTTNLGKPERRSGLSSEEDASMLVRRKDDGVGGEGG